jgi:GH25 family lysozyme M1 (1,4-beta-N-acetylmuramidase)
MHISPRGRRRRLLTTAAALSVTLVVLSPTIASASPADPTTPAVSTPTEDHAMGSQIRKHEGTGPPIQQIDASDIGIQATVQGIDVASHQGNVDWPYWWGQGKRFVWVKATEGTTYRNPYFTQQYNGSYNQGFIRGAYHFALPNRSSGSTQATFFSNNGGGWSGDGRTLPGALDMEYNPYGATCYGLSRSQMIAWIRSFSDTYKARWNKWPAIYTSTSWWNQCVNGDFHTTNPLWVARYASAPGTLPYNWSVWTVWQYSSAGNMDKNVFNGDMTRLRVFATNHD